MWSKITLEKNSKFEKIEIRNGLNILSFKKFIDLILNSDEFILFFSNVLAQCEFNAFFFEVKPLNLKTLDNSFQFVLYKNNLLETLKPNISHFKNKLDIQEGLVVTFSNLKKDALLIVPKSYSNDIIIHILLILLEMPLKIKL